LGSSFEKEKDISSVGPHGKVLQRKVDYSLRLNQGRVVQSPIKLILDKWKFTVNVTYLSLEDDFSQDLTVNK